MQDPSKSLEEITLNKGTVGIKKFLNSLLGQSENQIPSSLGRGVTKEPDTINLGANIKQSKDEDDSSIKIDENQEIKEDKASEAKDKQGEQSAPASDTYNLIILDESGSMLGVRHQTISGCNETLNSIRNTAKEQPDNKQYVSIFCFDNTNSRYIFQNVPVEDTRDLTTADYSPNSCTPLYDAIGYTVTQLRRLIAESGSVAVHPIHAISSIR